MLLIDFEIYIKYRIWFSLMIQYIEMSEICNYYETLIILKKIITFCLFKS